MDIGEYKALSAQWARDPLPGSLPDLDSERDDAYEETCPLRFRFLRSLTSETSTRFGTLVQEVAAHYQVQYCVIALEGTDGIHLISRVGLAVDFIPHSSSQAQLCRHWVDRDLPTILEDLSTDRRFSHDPLVEGPPHVQFYVGAPLYLSERRLCGALCIFERSKSSPFSLNRCRFLQEKAAEVVAVLENQPEDEWGLRT